MSLPASSVPGQFPGCVSHVPWSQRYPLQPAAAPAIEPEAIDCRRVQDSRLAATTPLGVQVLRCLGAIQDLLDPRAVIAGSAGLAHMMHLSGVSRVVAYNDVDVWVPFPLKDPASKYAVCREGGGSAITCSSLAAMFRHLDVVLGGGVLFDVELHFHHGSQVRRDGCREPGHTVVDFKLRLGHRYATRSHRYATRSNADNRRYQQMQLIFKMGTDRAMEQEAYARRVIGDFDISCVRCAVLSSAGEVLATDECQRDAASRQFRYTMKPCLGGYGTVHGAQERRIAKYVGKGFRLRQVDFGTGSELSIRVAGTSGV